MKHTARTAMTPAEVISALDRMPKERGSDFSAGRVAARAVNRTYTRVDRNQFQVSRTAGMGSPVVVSGKVMDDDDGGAVVFLSTTFGFLPLGPSLVAVILLWALGIYFLSAGEFYGAAACAILFGYAVVWFVRKFGDARYLRSQISEHLGGITWELKK